MRKLIVTIMVFVTPMLSFADIVFTEAKDLCKNKSYIECGSPKKATINTTDLRTAFEGFVDYVNSLPTIPAGLKMYQKGLAGLSTKQVEDRSLASSIDGNKYTFLTALKVCNGNSLKKCLPTDSDLIDPLKKIGNAKVEFTINPKSIDIVLYVWGEK